MFNPFHRKKHSYLIYRVWLLSPFMRYMENETQNTLVVKAHDV